MLTVYPFDQLGNADHGWLQARHHFSFSSYHNPKRMGFGALRVINDDIVQPGTGFATHPHDNMEIITYVRQGAITHRDSQGNEGRTTAGDVQVMSAGTGIRHSEYNHEDEATHLYQIWIEPNKRDIQPRWDAAQFPQQPVSEALNLLVSGDGKAPLSIYQDATIHGGRILSGTVITHPIKNQAYILVAVGEVEIEGQMVRKGDGAQISGQSQIEITAGTDAELLVLDVPASHS